MRRSSALIRSFAAAVAIGAASSVSVVHAPALRPNILFIVIDDLRDWVGYLHRHPQAKTPSLDALAARGVHFTRAYCAAPVCNPSRAATMSGLRPFTTGVYENDTDWRPMVPEALTLPTTFRRAGYFVCGAGKVYHTAYTRRSEWDDYLDDEGSNPKPKQPFRAGKIAFGPLDCDDDAMREAKIVDYAIRQLQRKHDSPLFLAVGLHKPHLPWHVPRKYFEMHPLDAIELPPYLESDLDDLPPEARRMALQLGDHAEIVKAGLWRPAVQAYLAATSFTDAMVGRLIAAFDRSAYRDNTIVCLWSDHGWSLGEKQHWRKFALWEEETRAPFLWIVPGVTRPSGVCDHTVDFMSIYPTLCDLAGIATPEHVEGRSIRALLADPRSPWYAPAITTYLYRNHTIRSQGWRYTRYHDGGEELYDELNDPNEWRNLAAIAEFTERKARLAEFLPTRNQADAGGDRRRGPADDSGDESTKKNRKRRDK